ncbi:MAG: alpha/beta fold hydrolase [Bacteroidales bacterium]
MKKVHGVSSYRRLTIVVVTLIILSTSCRKDEGTSFTYYRSSERLLTYKTSYVTSLINSMAGFYPRVDTLNNFVDAGINVYSMIYKTAVEGNDIDASGLVCFPDQEGEYPVLCFLNGTNTMNAYAPSNFVISSDYQFIEFIASMGFIVIIPDYPGFGESSGIPHPYLVKEPTVSSVIDMIRAVNESSASIQSGIKASNKVYLSGYSQGGWAAMAVHEALEKNFSAEFDLSGTVCGAGPYDIMFLLENIATQASYPMPVYFGYIINAYNAYNQFDNQLSEILNPPYDGRVLALYDGKHEMSYINSQLTTNISDLLAPGFITGFGTGSSYSVLRQSLADNSITPYKTTVPLFLFHGGSDTQVLTEVTEHFYEAMRQAGTMDNVIRKKIYPGLDHGDAAVPGLFEGLLFLLGLNSGN